MTTTRKKLIIDKYMTLTNGGGANINTFSGGGVNLITGDGVSWGGVAYPATPANYPRGFIGGITFIAAVPCTAPPTAGAAGTGPACAAVRAFVLAGPRHWRPAVQA